MSSRPQVDPRSPRSAISYFFREASRRIWRSKRISVTAILMIAIALTVLGSFLIIADNIQQSMASWDGRNTITVYLHQNTAQEQIDTVRAVAEDVVPEESVQFVSREEASRRFKANFTGLANVVDELGENPFPPSLEITVSRAQIESAAYAPLLERLRAHAAVDQVQFDHEWVARVRGVVRGIRFAGLVAGGILAIAAAFTTANVIRLGIVTYQEEIDIMRLVGAAEWMVRGPLFVQGLLQGLIGAGLALATLAVLFASARGITASTPTLISSALLASFLSPARLALIIAGGALAGLIGGWMSLGEIDEEVAVRS